MTAETIVIVGNGQGGLQTAVSLRDGGHDGLIVLIGDEPGLPYQRPPLSKAFLAGGLAPDALLFRTEAYYAEHRIEHLAGLRATAIDRASRRVQLDTGSIPYDHLVLATGARDRVLPVPGAGLDGVCRLRTRVEAGALRTRMASADNIVVVGAGFIGLEFAASAVKQGARVHVIEMALRPMARAITPEMSAFFHASHAAAGTTILFGATVARIVGTGDRVTAVETADGTVMPADLVLLGVGVQPNTELAEAAGLQVANGIVVDEAMLTSDPAISALGDCASFPCRFAGGCLTRLESVQNAADQARAVAARLLGRPAPYHAVPWFWSEQGSLRLQIAGLTEGHDTTVLRGDKHRGSFSVFAFQAGRLRGVESVNRPVDHMIGRRLLSDTVALTPEQAADESFDLKALLATARRGPNPSRPLPHNRSVGRSHA